MPLNIDPTLPDDVQVLIKACSHLVSKAYAVEDPQTGMVRRYSVPIREFERVRAKVRRLTNG